MQFHVILSAAVGWAGAKDLKLRSLRSFAHTHPAPSLRMTGM